METRPRLRAQAKPSVRWLCLALLTLAACITVNVYFPEAAVKDLSEKIEQEVRRQAAEDTSQPAAPEERPGEPGAGLAWVSWLTGASPAWAQSQVPAPEVTNPAIRKIIASRAARLGELNRYKSLGVVGETNQALVEVRNLDSLPDLRQRAEAQRLVRDENADREQLFREIAAAENVDLSQLPRIRQTYAETLRQQARTGDWIQLPDGTWRQK